MSSPKIIRTAGLTAGLISVALPTLRAQPAAQPPAQLARPLTLTYRGVHFGEHPVTTYETLVRISPGNGPTGGTGNWKESTPMTRTKPSCQS